MLVTSLGAIVQRAPSCYQQVCHSPPDFYRIRDQITDRYWFDAGDVAFATEVVAIQVNLMDYHEHIRCKCGL